MDNTQLLDGDGDGLPDHDTQRNTYNCWNFFGTPSYIASLWLAALRASVRLAQKWEILLGHPNGKNYWIKGLKILIKNYGTGNISASGWIILVLMNVV